MRRNESISNSIKKTFEAQIQKWDAYEVIMQETIMHSKITEKEKYLSLAKEQFAKRKIDIAFDYYNKKEAKEYYHELKENSTKNLKYYLRSIFADNRFFHIINQIKSDELASE